VAGNVRTGVAATGGSRREPPSHQTALQLRPFLHNRLQRSAPLLAAVLPVAALAQTPGTIVGRVSGVNNLTDEPQISYQGFKRTDNPEDYTTYSWRATFGATYNF
jgi:hypothetical protein